MIKNNFKKEDLSKKLSNKIGYSSLFSKKIINDVIDTLISIIKNKRVLILKDVGSFKVIFKKERSGRNPKTKEIYAISERNVISFKASKDLLTNLNKDD